MDEIMEMNYAVFLAEQEYFTNTIIIGSNIVHESTGLIVITEDFKSNIENYIVKIVKAIQTAWDKFKAKIVNSAFKPYLKNIGPQVAKFAGTCDVENFPNVWDLNKQSENIYNLNLIEYTPDMLMKYKSKEEIIKDKFPFLNEYEDKSFKKNLISYSSKQDFTGTLNQDEIRKCYNFAYLEYNSYIESLQDYLTFFNKEVNNIKSTIGAENSPQSVQDTSTQTTQTTSSTTTVNGKDVNEAAILYETVLMEAIDTDPNGKKEGGAVKINATPNGQSGANAQKIITWIIGINTDIISAGMLQLRKAFMSTVRLMRALFKEEKGEKQLAGNGTVKIKNGETNPKDQIEGI